MSKLIIDPGHGGRDPGGGTNKLWKEKDKVLEISLYQFERFKELGVSVELTRTKDVYLSAATRTNKVRGSRAKHCISNHINAGGGQGAETIHSIYSDGKFAKLILDELRAVGQNTRRSFTRTLPGNPKKDYYFMNRDTGNVSTVIVEYGFADNKTDTERIRDNWKVYAEAVVKAYCGFIGHKYTAPGKKAEAPKKESKPAADKKETKPSAPKKETSSKPKAKIEVDGKWGKATTRALQKYLGTKVDGIISDQLRNSVSEALYGGTVEFGNRGKGSLVIKTLQKLIGAKVDGYLGPETARKLQGYLGTSKDGKLSRPSLVVIELQKKLNEGTL